MPLFAWIGYDGPRGAELRKLHREAHLANLAPLDAAGRVVHAGPLLGEDGSPLGSLILFEAADLPAARAFAAQDPYVVGGVFERYEVHPTRVTFPRSRV
ncbi:MAG TPA: YciI family protein [Myxococcota bacterium]|nr:YciI family protein [Myxococcota bacterium]